MKKYFMFFLFLTLLQAHVFASNPTEVVETQSSSQTTSLLGPSEVKPQTMKEEFKEASEKIGNAFKKIGQKIKSAFRKNSNEQEIKNDVVGE